LSLVQADFAQTVERLVAEGLPRAQHPFTCRVLAGEASRQDLAIFAVQTYHRNLYSSRFAAANFAHCPYLDVRRGLFEVIREEELKDLGEPPSHAELMLRFAQALGMEREDVINARPLPSTLAFIDVIMQLSEGHWLEGLAFRASEIHAPRGSGMWRKALQEHYGLSDEAVAWWSTHETADVEHGNIALKGYGTYATDETSQQIAAHALQRMMAAWWVFWDGIEGAAQTARQGHDVGFRLPCDPAASTGRKRNDEKHIPQVRQQLQNILAKK